MTDLLPKLFVGPAVVVDDKIDEADSGILPVLEELDRAQIPTLKLRSLPDVRQIRHWHSLSMVILDWELFSGDPLIPGVSIPPILDDSNSEQLAGFIRAVMDEVFCPIFVVSSQDVDLIWAELISRIPVGERILRSRIFVRTKTGLESSLFSILGEWVAKHPAIYTLKSWEREYELAKDKLFRDFEATDVAWPRVLWLASIDDSVNPNHELTETINRNLYHRMDPLVFDPEIIRSPAAEEVSKDALRRVLHGQAVVPGQRLHADVVMPGDFFYRPKPSGGPPSRILLNVSPACDLVPRKGKWMGRVRLHMLLAELVSRPAPKKKTVDNFLKNDRPAEQVVHFFLPDGHPYAVHFKSSFDVQWRRVVDLRQGRLLEPYITSIQQRFALHSHRLGLPRVPTEFYL